MTSRKQSWALNRFALATAGITFLLIVMGAFVTNTDAGDTVPTWPLAFGEAFPVSHLSGGVMYEYFHRVIAAVTGLLTLALAVWIFIQERRGWVKWVGVLTLVLLTAQVLLGGMRISLGEAHGSTVAMLHALSAQLFLGVIVSLTVFTSPGWVRAGELRSGYPRMKNPLVQYVSTTATVVVVVQILLGAAYRHDVMALIPHAAAGIVVAIMVMWASVLVIRLGHDRDRSLPYIVRPARFAAWILIIQLVLGIGAYVMWPKFAHDGKIPDKVILIAVLHTLFAAILLMNQVILMLRVYRMVPITEKQD
jgi:heme a synthase